MNLPRTLLAALTAASALLIHCTTETSAVQGETLESDAAPDAPKGGSLSCESRGGTCILNTASSGIGPSGECPTGYENVTPDPCPSVNLHCCHKTDPVVYGASAYQCPAARDAGADAAASKDLIRDVDCTSKACRVCVGCVYDDAGAALKGNIFDCIDPKPCGANPTCECLIANNNGASCYSPKCGYDASGKAVLLCYHI